MFDDDLHSFVSNSRLARIETEDQYLIIKFNNRVSTLYNFIS